MRLYHILAVAILLTVTAPVIGDDAIWLNLTTDYTSNYIYADNAAGDTYNNLHDAATGTGVGSSGFSPRMEIDSTSTSGKYRYLYRGIQVFNTNDLPLTADILNVSLTWQLSSDFSKTLDTADEVCLVYAYPSNPLSITTGDFQKFGTKIYDSITLTDLSYPQTVTFYIEDDGIIKKNGYTVIGWRLKSDVDKVAPAWVSSKSNKALIASSGVGEPLLNIYYHTYEAPTPTPTPYPGNISVNVLEKYSNAALINQAITLTPTAGGPGEIKTSLYGETLHFGVVPGMEYWFNASRTGYKDYNQTYTIPASPGIYNVYMERILTPIANHSYAHFSVVDQTNGGLIPNAEIRLSDGQTKLTNSAGYAWFSVNNSEQINYYVSKPSGYWPAYGAMNLTADESILVALQRYTGPTATATMPGWTPVTVPTTGTGVDPVVTLSAQLRQQNVQEGMDVWYTNLPFISQFLVLLFIIGGLGLMSGGTRRN
jgi:hypothetical protein